MKTNVPIKADSTGEKSVPIKRGIIFASIALMFIGLISLWVLGVYKIDDVKQLASSGVLESESMMSTYLESISKKIWLPNEKLPPRMFEIVDPDLLISKQSFYKGAIIGDVLFVFDESKRAILYSPKRDVIINFGSISYHKEYVNEIIENNQNI